MEHLLSTRIHPRTCKLWPVPWEAAYFLEVLELQVGGEEGLKRQEVQISGPCLTSCALQFCCSCALSKDDVMNRTPVAQEIVPLINKWDHIKLKSSWKPPTE